MKYLKLQLIFIFVFISSFSLTQRVNAQQNLSEVISVAEELNTLYTNMVLIEGGSFQMGQTEEQEQNMFGGALPVHEVVLNSFMIGKYEITQRIWFIVMKNNPSENIGDDLPVENVSWNDCVVFINRLNRLTGKQYRLPTEAEWEYACRGGKLTKKYTYCGDNKIDKTGWFSKNSKYKTHKVGAKKANELGLYDMSGNVWEWCEDWAGNYSAVSLSNPHGPKSGESKIIRGGSFTDPSSMCTASYRGNATPTVKDRSIGLRLCLNVKNEEVDGVTGASTSTK